MPQLKNKKKLKKTAAKKKVIKTKKTVKVKKSAARKISKPKKTVKAKKTVKVKKSAARKISKPKKTVKAKKAVKVKKSAAKKISKPKKTVKENKAFFTAAEIKTVTKQLQALRKSLSDMVKTKKEMDLVEHDTGDSIDLASQSLDKEMLFELSGNELIMLDDVNAAIRRIENGVYGLCEYCRKPIKKLRLKAIPQARYCLQCQSGNERRI